MSVDIEECRRLVQQHECEPDPDCQAIATAFAALLAELETARRDALSWKEKAIAAGHVAEETHIYYMGDDHYFTKLPLDEDKAIATMREQYVDNGRSYGMLCGTGTLRGTAPIHARSVAEWAKFEAAARPWLRCAIPIAELDAGGGR